VTVEGSSLEISAVVGQYPMLYAEMFAYSMAAAQLGLRHALVPGLMTGCMVGWPAAAPSALQPSVAAVTRAATPAAPTAMARKAHSSRAGASSCFVSPLTPPTFLHYCQHYASASRGETFGKRAVPHGVLACPAGATGGGVGAEGGDHRLGGGLGQPKGASSRTTDHATGAHQSSASRNWNELAYCAVTRAIEYARETGCAAR
jgi:hypothetical protein